MRLAHPLQFGVIFNRLQQLDRIRRFNHAGDIQQGGGARRGVNRIDQHPRLLRR